MDPELRYFSGAALGRTKDATALSPLLHALTDSHREVRFGALHGLRSLGDPRAIMRIRSVLESDPDLSVRSYAITVLEAFRSEPAAEALVAAALNANEVEQIRTAAILALGHVDSGPVALKLQPLLSADDEPIKAAAAVICAHFNNRNSIPVLVGLTLSPAASEDSRNSSLIALEKITGEVFGGYVAADKPAPTTAERNTAMRRVADWWEDNRRFYQ